MTEEVAEEGNRKLAKFLGCSQRTACRLVKEMKEIGVVFEQFRGRPPQKVNMWFPSVVKSFMAARQRAINSDQEKK